MRITNTKFTEDVLFQEACLLADIPATTRQASKYRRGLGLAVGFKQKARGRAVQRKIKEVWEKLSGKGKESENLA